MKRVINAILLLILVGAVLYVAFMAKLIPNPFDRKPGPVTPATSTVVQRETLRVSVADRPEKLFMASLQRLLAVDGHKLELVEYNPQTVWLELAAGEIDVVIAPLGEAVKAQGRFQAGRFLLFTGESIGLDKVIAWPEAATADRVAVQQAAGTDFLARQMLPEATVVPAAEAKELEAWLRGKAVQAALIDTSSNAPELLEKFKVLSTTSEEQPMPSVAVLSKAFAENSQQQEYTARRDTLVAALQSWNRLVGYLDTQPELLKSTLKSEAAEMGVDLDRLLEGYRYLSPSRGRQALLDSQEKDSLKETLDLLVLSGVSNLTGPDWNSTIEAPSFLEPSWSLGASAEALPNPEAVLQPTPAVAATPGATTTPQISSPSSVATYHYQDFTLPGSWPEPELVGKARESLVHAPALSQKAIAVATSDNLIIHPLGEKKAEQTALGAPPTTAPLSDGRSFYYGTEDKIAAVNSAGKEIWSLKVQGSPFGASAVVDSKLLYALGSEQGGRLLCLDSIDGEILWEQALSSPPASGPVVGGLQTGNAVIVLDQTGEIRAFALENGANLWTHKLDEASFLSPAAGYGKLAVTYPSGEVVLISLQEGKRIWEVSLDSSLTAPPTLINSGVLVPSKDTYLYMLAAETGDIAWKTRLSQTISEPAVVAGNQIIQSDEGGKVHTLTLDGTLVSSVEVTNSWVSRVVPFDGRWAVGDSSGAYRVY